MEKRKYSRVIFRTEATIRWNNYQYRGSVKDLSLKGAYIEIIKDLNIEIGQAVDVSFYLCGTTSELKINMKATVFRKDRGIGIKFTSIDLDSFIYLKNIIAYNYGSLDQIMDEFYKQDSL